MKKNHFSFRNFYFFYLILVFLNWFWSRFVQFWRFPEVLRKSRNPRWRIQDGRNLAIMSKLPRHITSSLRDADFKGEIFGRTIYPSSVTVIAFILAPESPV